MLNTIEKNVNNKLYSPVDFYKIIHINISKRAIFFILTVSTALLTIACDSKSTPTIERENNPSVYGVENNDKAMNAAIEKAKETFDEFSSHFDKNNDNDAFYYSIKQEFSAPDNGSEHMWITDIHHTDNKFIGVVNNEPVFTTEVAYGDTIAINTTKISDWMIVNANKGTAKGGYTIRVLREDMTEDEKQAFDMNFGLVFE